jgi:surface-anchored protein
VIANGHNDLFGIAFSGGLWDIHIHNEELDQEFDPSTTLIHVHDLHLQNRPAGAQWDFLGPTPPAGQPMWFTSQTETDLANKLLLGLETAEVPNGVFVGDQITVSMLALRGPGHFSWYRTSTGDPVTGTPTVSLSSFAGPSSFVTDVGNHVDFSSAFSQPGFYEIDIQVSGNLVGGGTSESDVVTYNFLVSAVPEPGTLSLMAVAGGTGGLVWFRRFRRQTAAAPSA